jgi:hypothetical protein
MVKAAYNRTALLRFVKVLMKKQQEMAAGDRYVIGPKLFSSSTPLCRTALRR